MTEQRHHTDMNPIDDESVVVGHVPACPPWCVVPNRPTNHLEEVNKEHLGAALGEVFTLSTDFTGSYATALRLRTSDGVYDNSREVHRVGTTVEMYQPAAVSEDGGDAEIGSLVRFRSADELRAFAAMCEQAADALEAEQSAT